MNKIMEKKILRCQSTTTYSSMVGNITSFIQTYFVSKFPKGFFKKEIITDTNSNVILKDKDLIKYDMPYIMIRPELSLDEIFIESQPYLYETPHYIVTSNSKRNQNYYPIFKDEEQGIYIHAIPSRVRINYQVKIKVPTIMYMYNTMQYINNAFEKNGYEFVNDVRLQTNIPKIMATNLAHTNGYDLSNVEDRTSFNDYLNKNSMNGIEEIINLSTGNSMYAFNFKTNIMNVYPERVQGDRTNKGLAVEYCMVTFNFSSEMWIPNKYIMEIPSTVGEVFSSYEEEPTDNSFKFNTVLDVSYILPKIEDKHLILKRKFVPDINVEYDTLDFSMIINDELREALNFLKKENALNTNIFEVVVMCGNKALMKSMYKVDYENFILKTNTPMSNTTYTVLLYGNLETLNKILNRDRSQDKKMQ